MKYNKVVSKKTKVVDLSGAIINSQIIFRNDKGIISNKLVGNLKVDAAHSRLQDPVTKLLDAGLKKAEASGIALQVSDDSMTKPELQYLVNELEQSIF